MNDTSITAEQNGDSNKIWSAEFLGCGLSSCLFYMSQYILIAGLPLIITAAYGGTAFQAGMAMTYFQIGTILCRPFAGEIIDGFDKRKVLLSTTGIFLLIMIAFYFTSSMDLIFLLRLLHGMVFAIGTTAVAAVAVLVLPKHRKGEGIGYFSVFVNVAMVIGPFLGLTILDLWDKNAYFIFLSFCALLSFYTANRKRLDDSLALPRLEKKRPWNFDRFIERTTLPWAIIGVFISFSYSGVLVFVPIMMTGMGQGSMASIFFVVFALIIVATRPWIGRAFDHLGANTVIYPGFILYSIGIAILSFATTPMWIIASAPIIGLGYGAISPAFQTLGVQAALAERAGTANATYFLSLDIGVGLGSAILSLIIDWVGFQTMYQMNTVIAIMGLLIYHFYVKRFYKRAA
ncbi:MAG: MFS transporter [Veillonella sp.]|uniref:MFS transporter n=1 Tax=Veillonella sp. TaxID=1926307 RepID=UPI0025CB9177|nr:MFS transporter [Veillonella sp.]MBS4913930.1 MFS transporter [Veillonella sp.]